MAAVSLEDRIKYETGAGYVYLSPDRKRLEVRVNKGVCSEVDCAFEHTEDGLSLAKARLDYITKQKGSK